MRERGASLDFDPGMTEPRSPPATHSAVPSIPVLQAMRAGFFCAMHAAIDLAAGLNPMADNLAITMRASRGQHVNRTLKAIKGSSLARRSNLKCLIVLVSAHIAFGHNSSLPVQPSFPSSVLWVSLLYHDRIARIFPDLRLQL